MLEWTGFAGNAKPVFLDAKTVVGGGSGGGSTVSYKETASGEVPQAKHS